MTAPAFRIINTAPMAAAWAAHLKREKAPSAGKPPRLEWIALKDLVIDTDYQRPITPVGERNIVRIAGGFDWTAFSTVIVAPAGLKGKYSIIDGQHRCHAAALLGIDKVPCQIVDAARAQQARAFEQVNGNATRVHSLMRYHALVVAGEPRAAAIASICAEAGVTICRYPVPAKDIKPRHTLLTFQIEKLEAAHGREAVVAALRAIVDSGRAETVAPFNAGMLKYEWVSGGAAAFAQLAREGWSADDFIRAYRTFDMSFLRAGGGGQHSRASDAREQLLRRVRASGVKPSSARRAALGDAAGNIVKDRHGVSLPRLKSLEGA